MVVIGEALIDVVTTPEGTTEHPGGSPANVAYGLARLGVPTGLLTSIGTDRRGDALEEHLAGVTLLPGAQSLERTSTATATIARDGSANYTIGAGDSYMSALILGLLTLLDRLGRTAATAAAITVSRAGARPPTEDELRATLQLQPPAAIALLTRPSRRRLRSTSAMRRLHARIRNP